MATACYSGTPLPKKLGINAGCHLALIDAPPRFDETLGIDPPEPEFPTDVAVHDDVAAHRDVVVFFTTERARFEAAIAELEASIFPAGGLWIAWPKKASKLETDLDFAAVQEAGLSAGLVDNKSCAIDDDWQALRFVFRLADR